MAKQITEEKQYSGHQSTQSYQTMHNHPNASHFNVPTSNQMNSYNNGGNMMMGFNQNNSQTNFSDGFMNQQQQGDYQQPTNYSQGGKMEFDSDSHHDQDKSKKTGGTGWQCH